MTISIATWILDVVDQWNEKQIGTGIGIGQKNNIK